MGLRLADMASAEAQGFLMFDGERVDFGYKPNIYSLELADRVEKAVNDDDGDVLACTLEPMLTWWDVLDDEGNRLPPTMDNLRKVPIRFLIALMDAVEEAQSPEAKG